MLASTPRHRADRQTAVESNDPALADSLAAALRPREPGWRLPRRSALARKHNVSLDQLDTAIGDLVGRALIRRLPDGQMYRTSPADRWVPVEGASGLACRLDPMGNTIECEDRRVSRQDAPPEVAAALGLPAGTAVDTVRTVWSTDGVTAAAATSYRPGDRDTEDFGPFAAAPTALAVAAARVSVGPADREAARLLGVAPGWPAVTVTARFSAPGAVAVVTMRAELFRVEIST